MRVLLLIWMSFNAMAGTCLESSSCLFRFYKNENFLSVYANKDPNLITPGEYSKAVIVIHGTGRNGNDYFDNFVKAAKKFNQEKQVLIIAPSFKRADDPKDGDELYWGTRWYQKWKFGYRAQNSDITSFGMMDELISHLKSKGLKKVLITGHSAGGQFTQRYAIGTEIDKELEVIFVPSNPSSYMYLHPERYEFRAGNYALKNLQTDCVEFHHYIYGPIDRPSYLQKDLKTLQENFKSKKLIYLMGEADLLGENLDKSCEAFMQGENRFERAQNFYYYVKKHFPNNNHRFVSLANVGHDNFAVYSSEKASEIFFDQVNAYPYLSKLIGNRSDYQTSNNQALTLLLGGGENEEKGIVEFLKAADGGDLVVITGKDYLNQRYTHDFWNIARENKIKLDSVESFSVTSKTIADHFYLLEKIKSAEAVFFTGGDQSLYVKNIKGTKLLELLKTKIKDGVALAGTSAGLAILGEYIFSANYGGISSVSALSNPFDQRIHIEHDFLNHPELLEVITDTHFSERKREGRLLSFMMRAKYDFALKNILGIGIDEKTSLIISNQKISSQGVGDVFIYRHDSSVPTQQNQGLNLLNVLKLKLEKNREYPSFSNLDFSFAKKLEVINGKVKEVK